MTRSHCRTGSSNGQFKLPNAVVQAAAALQHRTLLVRMRIKNYIPLRAATGWLRCFNRKVHMSQQKIGSSQDLHLRLLRSFN